MGIISDFFGMSAAHDFFDWAFSSSRQGNEATGNETAEADKSTKKRRTKHKQSCQIDFIVLRTKAVHYIPCTQSEIIRSDVCYNCKNNADCKAYQNMLVFANSFTCENCQSTTIQQEQRIEGNLCKIGSDLVKKQHNLIAKRIAIRHIRSSRLHRIRIHTQLHKAKQRIRKNIIKDFIRQTHIERFL